MISSSGPAPVCHLRPLANTISLIRNVRRCCGDNSPAHSCHAHLEEHHLVDHGLLLSNCELFTAVVLAVITQSYKRRPSPRRRTSSVDPSMPLVSRNVQVIVLGENLDYGAGSVRDNVGDCSRALRVADCLRRCVGPNKKEPYLLSFASSSCRWV